MSPSCEGYLRLLLIGSERKKRGPDRPSDRESGLGRRQPPSQVSCSRIFRSRAEKTAKNRLKCKAEFLDLETSCFQSFSESGEKLECRLMCFVNKNLMYCRKEAYCRMHLSSIILVVQAKNNTEPNPSICLLSLDYEPLN